MSEEITNEASMPQDDSGVIKALRKQIKDLEADLQLRPDRSTLEGEVRAQLARETATESVLTDLGHPSGMAGVVLSRIEGDVTADTVKSALEGLGYEIKPASSDEPSTSNDQNPLAEVSTLSGQISSAASGQIIQDIDSRLAAAKSPAEVAAIMAEAQATASY